MLIKLPRTAAAEDPEGGGGGEILQPIPLH